jgi:2-polyprenyl-3-methyl-5-hydroxy-6-metoxy-1,4-benzoquinol methylase
MATLTLELGFICGMSVDTTMAQSVFEETATIRSWDRDYYHPIAERLYDRAIKDMLALMGTPSGSTILDAGCGPGVHSIRVARAGHHVVAVDISQAMLQQAEVRIAQAAVAQAVDLKCEDLTQLRFPNASFRYVFSWGVIIHIQNVEKALDELARILGPGGTLALYISNRAAWDQKLETFARFLLRKPLKERSHLSLGDGTWYDMHGQRLWVWQFDIPELVRQLAARGLHLMHRRCGEFSELQRRVPGALRNPLLRLNNFYYRNNFPAGPTTANMLIFRKEA